MDAAAVGPADGSTNGVSLGGGSRAIERSTTARSAAGSSIPPRWTTKPNEIPADSTSTRSAANVRRGTADAPGRGGRVLERHRSAQVARAVGMGRREADELLLSGRLGPRGADRRAPVAVVGLVERGDEVALELEAEERADRRSGEREASSRNSSGGRIGAGSALPRAPARRRPRRRLPRAACRSAPTLPASSDA